MKRFYKQAAAVARDGGGYGVDLDGRAIKTPAKAPFTVPGEALSAAVAEEWNAQGDKVAPETMPLMTLASTALDRVIPQHDDVAKTVSAYGASDLLCYWADNPQELVERQRAGWQPVLDWAMQRYDAPLKVTGGIIHVTQDATTVEALDRAVASYDAFRLTALHEFTSITGSLILGLAIMEGHLDVDAAFALSRIDEEYQIELWGRDEEAETNRQNRERDLKNAARFLSLL